MPKSFIENISDDKISPDISAKGGRPMSFLNKNLTQTTSWDSVIQLILVLSFLPYIPVLISSYGAAIILSMLITLLEFAVFIYGYKQGEDTGEIKIALLIASLPASFFYTCFILYWFIIRGLFGGTPDF
ncbi:MAG: hypothetical protein AB1757_11225 [Acidobacteriota bacterium]